MLRSEFASESAGNGERLAARLLTKFVFHQCRAMAELGGGDISRGYVLSGVIDANIRHLRYLPDHGRRHGSLTAIPSDDQRRPISISALARNLRMPYETTRRHIAKLIEDGACVRVSEKGVIVPSAWLAERNDVTVKIYDSLRTLLSMLHSAGFDLEGMATLVSQNQAPPVAAE